MPDDASSQATTRWPDPRCRYYERQVRARYLDASARGLGHEGALREAAALLWMLLPSASPKEAEEIAASVVMATKLWTR
jgi:hypothetical protein